MSTSRSRNYLRARRKALGLSQRELAAFLGVSRSAITKAENAVRPPPLKLLIVSEIIFGASGPEIFPNHYADIEEALRLRAAALLKELPGNSLVDAFRAFLTDFLIRRSSYSSSSCRQPPLTLP